MNSLEYFRHQNRHVFAERYLSSALLYAYMFPMDSDDYLKAQVALAGLKGAVHSLLSKNPQGLSNAEIGRALGIYQGHKGHEGHISRTALAFLEAEGTAEQNVETKAWSLIKR